MNIEQIGPTDIEAKENTIEATLYYKGDSCQTSDLEHVRIRITPTNSSFQTFYESSYDINLKKFVQTALCNSKLYNVTVETLRKLFLDRAEHNINSTATFAFDCFDPFDYSTRINKFTVRISAFNVECDFYIFFKHASFVQQFFILNPEHFRQT